MRRFQLLAASPSLTVSAAPPSFGGPGQLDVDDPSRGTADVAHRQRSETRLDGGGRVTGSATRRPEPARMSAFRGSELKLPTPSGSEEWLNKTPSEKHRSYLRSPELLVSLSPSGAAVPNASDPPHRRGWCESAQRQWKKRRLNTYDPRMTLCIVAAAPVDAHSRRSMCSVIRRVETRRQGAHNV